MWSWLVHHSITLWETVTTYLDTSFHKIGVICWCIVFLHEYSISFFVRVWSSNQPHQQTWIMIKMQTRVPYLIPTESDSPFNKIPRGIGICQKCFKMAVVAWNIFPRHAIQNTSWSLIRSLLHLLSFSPASCPHSRVFSSTAVAVCLLHWLLGWLCWSKVPRSQLFKRMGDAGFYR